MLERIAAYWQSQLVFVAAKLGIADALVAGPLTVNELAAQVGAHHLTLAVSCVPSPASEYSRSDPHGRFHLNRLAQTLRSDHPESLRNFALMLVDDYNWSAWGAFEHAVRTGDSAIEHVHGAPSLSLDAWQHPEKEKDVFGVDGQHLGHGELRCGTGLCVREACSKVVDVGGAHGHLLACYCEVMCKVRGVLFDQPGSSRRPVRAGSITCLGSRAAVLRRLGGDFFEVSARGR